jgi:hypothetical protein
MHECVLLLYAIHYTMYTVKEVLTFDPGGHGPGIYSEHNL